MWCESVCVKSDKNHQVAPKIDNCASSQRIFVKSSFNSRWVI